MRLLCALVLGAVIVAGAANAAGIDQLQAFVDGTKSARATFAQTTTDRVGRKVQQATGTFVFARPGRFRWTYDKPLDQLIVGDGTRVWVYDRDLDQVIVRKMGDALGATPAALLAGDNALEKNFTLVDGGHAEGLDWVDATPKSADAGFTSVKLGFRDQLPRAMILTDNLGQTTRLTFDGLVRNPQVGPDQFTFTPPAGADVIGSPR
ncbi:MAG: outer membrane lipoprotein chaperone LolA [Proteobacteria bacterium]|nr:outer membrane lipoprotein chaperone LolA [Pseudomonadota bacterium]